MSSVSLEEIRSLFNSESEETYEIFSSADVAIIRRLAAENNNNTQQIMTKIGDIIWQEYASDEEYLQEDIDYMLSDFYIYTRYGVSDNLNNAAKNFLKAAALDIVEKSIESVVKNLAQKNDKEIVAILDAESLRQEANFQQMEPFSIKNFHSSLLNIASIRSGLDEVAFLRKIIKEHGSFANYVKNSGEQLTQEIKQSSGYKAASNHVKAYFTNIGKESLNQAYEEFLLTVCLDNIEHVFNVVAAMAPEKSDQDVFNALVFGAEPADLEPELAAEEKSTAPRMRM